MPKTLNGENAKLFQKKIPNRTKSDIFVLNGPNFCIKWTKKSPCIRPKRLKMYEKGQKIEFWDLKYLLLSGIFLSGIWEYPPPPLMENHSGQKPLAELGVDQLSQTHNVTPLTLSSFSEECTLSCFFVFLSFFNNNEAVPSFIALEP